MIAFPRPHTARIRSRRAARGEAGGLTLVELMIAMMLGLLVTVSASAIFISNRQTYRATEGLGRVQENGRMAFELMARDLREAGGNPCGNADRKEPVKLVNVINNPNSRWWTGWNEGIVGYEAAIAVSPPANRFTGADAIDLMYADSATSATVSDHDTAGAVLTLNRNDHGLSSGDLAIICDWTQASLFQITDVSGDRIFHQNSGSPGNCSRGLGYARPAVCSAGGQVKEYGPSPFDANASATVTRMQPVRWYVGTPAGGVRSLMRATVVNDGGVLQVREQQIAEGVNNMQLQYLLEDGTAYVDATAITADRWDDVVAVRVTLDMLSADRAGVGGAQLARRIAHTVTLRNRME